MTAADVLEILDRLDAVGVEWWIDGGWGVDALLGRETRLHNDLDFAVRAEDIMRLPTALPEHRLPRRGLQLLPRPRALGLDGEERGCVLRSFRQRRRTQRFF